MPPEMLRKKDLVVASEPQRLKAGVDFKALTARLEAGPLQNRAFRGL
jgi:hypothetical protein